MPIWLDELDDKRPSRIRQGSMEYGKERRGKKEKKYITDIEASLKMRRKLC